MCAFNLVEWQLGEELEKALHIGVVGVAPELFQPRHRRQRTEKEELCWFY